MIYVCNSKVDRVMFFIARDKRNPIEDEIKCLSISPDQNIANLGYHTNGFRQFYRLITCTMRGNFVREMRFRPHLKEIKSYNYVFYTLDSNCISGYVLKRGEFVIESFLFETGKFQSLIILKNSKIFEDPGCRIHHVNGKLVFVTKESIFHLFKGCNGHETFDATLKLKEISYLNKGRIKDRKTLIFSSS